jgi:cobalt-zinc-cadmium efflux system protein
MVPTDHVHLGHHDHHHAAAGRGRLAAVLALTTAVLIAQVIGAVVSGSLSLLADAGHMVTDVAGLALALFAAVLAARPPTSRRTWGFLRAEVLAAGAQATVLLGVGVVVLSEAVRRLLVPPEVEPAPMAAFGAVGLAGNLIAVTVLAGTDRSSLNLRAAFLEAVSDALGSGSVLTAAWLIATTGWTRFDAVASLVIAALIVPRTLGLLRESLDILLESAPPGLDLDDVRAHIVAMEHVVGVHDVHASLVATGLPVLTAHVVVTDECFHNGCVPRILDALQTCLSRHFDVEHSTFQIEPARHAAHEGATHV